MTPTHTRGHLDACFSCGAGSLAARETVCCVLYAIDDRSNGVVSSVTHSFEHLHTVEPAPRSGSDHSPVQGQPQGMAYTTSSSSDSDDSDDDMALIAAERWAAKQLIAPGARARVADAIADGHGVAMLIHAARTDAALPWLWALVAIWPVGFAVLMKQLLAQRAKHMRKAKSG